jgi:predicted membrane protein
MPFCLLFFGILFLVAGVRDKQADLTKLLHDDFTGKNNFLVWTLCIVLIGAIGYVPRLKRFSDAFLALLVLVLFLHNGANTNGRSGFFKQFSDALGIKTKGA